MHHVEPESTVWYLNAPCGTYRLLAGQQLLDGPAVSGEGGPVQGVGPVRTEGAQTEPGDQETRGQVTRRARDHITNGGNTEQTH